MLKPKIQKTNSEEDPRLEFIFWILEFNLHKGNKS